MSRGKNTRLYGGEICFEQNNYEVFMNESKMEKCGSWKYSLFGCFVLFFFVYPYGFVPIRGVAQNIQNTA